MKKKIMLAVLASLVATTSFAETIKVSDKEDIIALLPRCETLEVKYVRLPTTDDNDPATKIRELTGEVFSSKYNEDFIKAEAKYANLSIKDRKALLKKRLRSNDAITGNYYHYLPAKYLAADLIKDGSACHVSIDEALGNARWVDSTSITHNPALYHKWGDFESEQGSINKQ